MTNYIQKNKILEFKTFYTLGMPKKSRITNSFSCKEEVLSHISFDTTLLRLYLHWQAGLGDYNFILFKNLYFIIIY